MFALIITCLVLLGFYAVFVEPMMSPRVTRYTVPFSTDDFGQKPLKIAVLTDLHACWPWMERRRIKRIVKQMNGLGADMIALLGDYHSGMHPPFARPLASVDEWAHPMGSIKAPLGAFAVLGNHDWQEGGESAIAALQRQGVTVLENQAVRVPAHGNTHLWVIGLGDQYGKLCDLQGEDRRDDLELALSQVEDDGSPRLLLAHEPDILRDAEGRVDLILSGHTHGGQVRLPFIGALTIPSFLDRKYAKGVFEENETTLIVGSGLGCSSLPLRFLCPPELLLIEINV